MASGGKLRVDLEALASSAAHVTGQGEDLASAHMSSDNRIVAAQSGWVGNSALALHTKTATWLEASRRLVTRVGEHALDLNDDGHSFAEMEQAHVETLQALHPQQHPTPAAADWRLTVCHASELTSRRRFFRALCLMVPLILTSPGAIDVSAGSSDFIATNCPPNEEHHQVR